MSPPFPRHESVCIMNNTINSGGGSGKYADHYTTLQKGFNEEMFQFEGFDWSKFFPIENVSEVSRLRLDRLRNCSHNWDKRELDKIMVPFHLMHDAWGSNN